jgi:hypothetical protein
MGRSTRDYSTRDRRADRAAVALAAVLAAAAATAVYTAYGPWPGAITAGLLYFLTGSLAAHLLSSLGSARTRRAGQEQAQATPVTVDGVQLDAHRAETPEQAARREKLAAVRLTCEAGIPYLDYDDGQIWPVDRQREWLAQQERRAAIERELLDLRHASELRVRYHARSGGWQAVYEHDPARRCQLQAELDRIDGKAAPQQTPPVQAEQAAPEQQPDRAETRRQLAREAADWAEAQAEERAGRRLERDLAAERAERAERELRSAIDQRLEREQAAGRTPDVIRRDMTTAARQYDDGRLPYPVYRSLLADLTAELRRAGHQGEHPTPEEK